MTRFNIPIEPKKKPIQHTVVIPRGSELYPFVFTQVGIKRSLEETLQLLLYATDQQVQVAIAKGVIDRPPAEIFEEAHERETLNNFIYNKKRKQTDG